MKKLRRFRYERGSNTIRSVPESYWVATVQPDNTLVFDSWDGAIKGRINKFAIRLRWKLGMISETEGMSPYQIMELKNKSK
jgi:hypothetical protein